MGKVPKSTFRAAPAAPLTSTVFAFLPSVMVRDSSLFSGRLTATAQVISPTS
jgi:hypothetical protein